VKRKVAVDQSAVDVKDGELLVDAEPEPEKLLPVTV